jgi:hypothetical protein
LPLLALRTASLIGGEAAEMKTLASENGPYLVGLGIEKRSHRPTDVHVGAAVANAHVEGQVAGVTRNGKMGGMRHHGHGKPRIFDGSVDKPSSLGGDGHWCGELADGCSAMGGHEGAWGREHGGALGGSQDGRLHILLHRVRLSRWRWNVAGLRRILGGGSLFSRLRRFRLGYFELDAGAG